mgnify:CR=1 FL=1
MCNDEITHACWFFDIEQILERNVTEQKLCGQLAHEFGRNDTCTSVDGNFHSVDLLVNVLHELDDEIHQLVLPHLLQVGVGNQERNVEVLSIISKRVSNIFKR